MASQSYRTYFEDLVRRHNHACFWSPKEEQVKRLQRLADFLSTHEPDHRFLDATFSADAPEVALMIFSHHGSEYYQAGFENNRNSPYPHLSFVFDGRSLGFLKLLASSGMPLKSYAMTIAQYALNRDNAEQFKFAEELLESPLAILGDLGSHKSIIATCGPNLAPRVLAELKNFEANYVAQSYSFNDLMPLKALAIWVLAGLDFSQLTQRISTHLHPIAAASGSNHGRLSLQSKEPDILDVIGRPSNRPFFGITDAK